jgi:hypothetical protein
MGQATVITNVPGPPFPVYCAGAKLVSMYPLGLINPGLGLFHAVFSYGGNVSVTILADRDQMPDPEFYRECLDAAWDELNEALLGSSRRKQAAPAAKRGRTAARKPAKPRPGRSKPAAAGPARRKAAAPKATARRTTAARAKPARKAASRKRS